MTLRDALVAKQAELKLTDGPFAEHLGVHRVTWLRIRRGGTVSKEVAEAACRTWRELLPIYTAELLGEQDAA